MTETLSPAPAGGPAPVVSMRGGWLQSITRPIQAFQLNYVPVVMVYFAYGALGLIDVTRDLWIKESLSLTPSQLAGIGVWLTLPWTVKMVFGELVDTVPIFGSQRKSYIIIGALLMVAGLVILAGAAGRWLTFTRPDNLYVLGAMLLVIGTVVQDVVADAMSTEVVPRHDAAGNERPDHKVRTELGMVQVLGRLAVSAGVLAVAGLSGWHRILESLSRSAWAACRSASFGPSLEPIPKDAHVFVSERGGPISPIGFHRLIQRLGEAAKMPFPIHPHMLRHACGFKLANDGHDTRALQHYLGHRNIQHTVRYTEMAPDRFKDFWRG